MCDVVCVLLLQYQSEAQDRTDSDLGSALTPPSDNSQQVSVVTTPIAQTPYTNDAAMTEDVQSTSDATDRRERFLTAQTSPGLSRADSTTLVASETSPYSMAISMDAPPDTPTHAPITIAHMLPFQSIVDTDASITTEHLDAPESQTGSMAGSPAQDNI